MRRAAALLLLLVLPCCTRREAPAAAVRRTPNLRRIDQPLPDDREDRLSIVTLARGATIVSRTGELLLETSALRAIDSDPLSFWIGPPRDLPQSLVIALPARTRIERVGIRTDDIIPTKHVQVDRSTDGVTFVPLITIDSRPIPDAQWFDVPPGEATHLRVTLVDRAAPDREARLRSFFVRGSELEPPHPGNLAGCWSLNDTRARFERHDSSVRGTIEMRNLPMSLDGGFDGRTYRFNWIRGNDYGYAMLSVSPDGRHFSGLEWHEEAIPLFYGDSWFGEPKPCNGSLQIASGTRERYLRRAGRLSLFGLRFLEDGSLDRAASAEALSWLVDFAKHQPVQLVAHEFRRATAAANREFAQRELDAVRAELQRAGVSGVTFVARGSDEPRQKPENDNMRAIYSTVDVEIRR